MCDPITAAGAALSIGGVLANSEAENQVSGARSGVMNAELARQFGYDSQTQGINNQARDRYAATGTDMDTRKKSVAEFYGANNEGLPTAGPTAGAMPASQSGIIVQEGKRQGEKTEAFNKQQNDASANLRSFGDVMATKSLGTARDAGELGIVNGFKAGSNSVLPLELQRANAAGNDMKMLGDVLGGVGQMATFAGLSGFDPFKSTTIAGTSPAAKAAPQGARAVSDGGGGIFSMFRR